jgi:two-component system cell cycle sensor histidine kinase/response regulator CckA
MALPKPVILVVDDNTAVARLMADILQIGGYEVIVASGGDEALGICERRAEPVDLLISDVIMPGISGPQLCRRLSSGGYARRCLLISGYSRESWSGDGPGGASMPLLVKPFTMPQLLETVRDILAASAPEQAAPPRSAA